MLTEEKTNSHLGKPEKHGAPHSGDSVRNPLRMELFSPEQRRERGLILGQEHHTGKQMRYGDRLLIRLRDNNEVLRTVHRSLVDDVNEKKPLVPVDEWLVDNFYVVEEQISLSLRHLPRKYLMELPRLSNPERLGVPRVYDLAEHIIAYGDGRVDAGDISMVVSAYQEATPLRLGELWAIPIMLRLALIENIRRLAALARRNRDDRESAWNWASALIRADEEDPKSLVLALSDMARAHTALSGAFVAEFKRMLQGRSSGMKMPLQWIEQNLAEQGRTIEQTVADENHEQAVLEVSMRNSITSLRALNVTDWNEFVETMSHVEAVLRKDPADVYGKMDFATRDNYRRVVERLARKSEKEEVDVAGKCLDLARNAAQAGGTQAIAAHVGYYLIGDGERDLCKALDYRMGFRDRLRKAPVRLVLFLYLGTIILLTAAFTAATAILAHAGGVRGDMLIIMTALLAFATSHLSVGLVNFIATQLVRPRTLPRLDFSTGIPKEQRTLVVVPTLLTSEKKVTKLLQNLETLFLNNRGENIHFGLLTDFPDADSETLPENAHQLNLCRLGIAKLNNKYPEDGGDNFYLFHRPRTWNNNEKVWMGWERKRGKLADLNRYLRGTGQPFSVIEGPVNALSNVRNVITLDADTQMARESAWQMAGAMAHPLVRPVYDARLGRVVSGHGILQPRVDATLAGAHRSHYARMCASEIGIDPYTQTSSDVYQDLFDEGSFVGKGIYDLEVFDRALGGRFPENKILSHDLIEGCVLRSGLLSEVRLYEDPPVSYLMDIQRRHRWVRGDWQIASYLFVKESKDGEQTDARPLNTLSRWKIFDNLRRSLVSIAIFLLLVLAFAFLRNPGMYLAVAAVVFLGPVFVAGVYGLLRKSPEKTMRQHIKISLFCTLKQAVQSIFKFSCIPFEACVCADAICRSLWRQCISHRRLLQWNPSDNSVKPDYIHVLPILRHMWIGPASAIAILAVVARKNADLLWYAAPLLLLWAMSPLFVCWLSRPRKVAHENLTDAQQRFLRQCARRIWRFFETFVGGEDNWLPPDNYQEYPVARIAHRTSPTNMGLSLLANLSAYDFGFISSGTLLERTGKSLETMFRMERYRGHFYNWYDTRTLDILHPAYVSTVDSGNLATHALVLGSGLRGLADGPALNPAVFAGLLDTMDLAVVEANNPGGTFSTGIDKICASLRESILQPPEQPAELYARLTELSRSAETLEKEWHDKIQGGERARHWLDAFIRQCRDFLAEIDLLVPWASAMADNEGWRVYDQLRKIPTLREIAVLPERITAEHGVPAELNALLARGGENALQRLAAIRKALAGCEDISHVDLDFLYDKSKRLLSIGFNVEEHRLDNSFYDLLASEARLAVYLGVAQHKIPQESWFALGRMLTLSGRRPLLISWSGSMFEYLMPLLVVPNYEDTLLDETCKACVSVQMEYAANRNVPWGISESGYNLFDSEQNYQYRAFGVPELGLKHALSDDLVVAPYASALATMFFPAQAAVNLQRLHDAGFQTSYGFHEAVDYTPSRLPHGAKYVVIRSYMAHHQGMSIVALGQALLDRPMHKRFEADPLLSSAAMLLQEMVPTEKAMYFHSTYSPEIISNAATEEAPMRVLTNPASPHPEAQLLSNGNYCVMVTAAGGGYSRWRDLSVTRWREDATRDNWGSFCYLRDRESGEVWSNTYQPTQTPASSFEAVFTEGRAEFSRRDHDFDCRTEIVVAPEDDVEVRRLKITNRTARERTLDVTSFAEVALAAQAADDSHQAFSKLFVQTRIVRDRQAIVCSRRPRDAKEKTPLMFHMLAVRGTGGGVISYETDRLRFFGRGNDASRPDAVWSDGERLGDSEGAVLDPVAAIRSPVRFGVGETVIIDLVTGVAEDETAIQSLMEKYQDERTADKAFDMAYTHGQLLLRQLDVSETDAQRYCRLAGSVVYANPALRAAPAVLLRNLKGQSGLWGYAISGDLPIVLLKITDPTRLQLANQLIQAHTYWREKGLKVDLVIWNEDQTGYRQTLHDQIVGLAGAALEDGNLERPGGIFIRSPDRIAEEDRILIQAVARVVLSDADGMLDEQMRRLDKSEAESFPSFAPARPGRREYAAADDVPVEKLVLDNGYGGFTPDGTEYVVVTDDDAWTPLPWVNVMANETFGTVVSEAGSGYTWCENAHEHRLTPWYNDPVSDGGGECIYIRDDHSGDVWSPTPLPCRGPGRYVARHGFGYSVFEHNRDGINSRLTVHVDKDAPVKFFTLRVTNNSDRRRNLSVTGYIEWVLGDLPGRTAMHVSTRVDTRSSALLARNQYSEDFRHNVAFFDVDDPGRTVCGDRCEFLGRNGSPASPLALQQPNLSGNVGPGMDPCGAVQAKLNLGPGQSREVVFRLGVGKNIDDARKLIKQFGGVAIARASLDAVKAFWTDTLGAVQVETPDTAFNFMANGWLLYQALSCRFWGRSATYQSGGAFGFRDQLQDSLALLYSKPSLVRRHLIECAAHQFPEGDVLHWWHPPVGRGVRTRCSDDYLWLPFVAERYIAVTGDTGVLDEKVRFIQGRPLREDEESYYDLPQLSEETATLYDHCRRSIEHGLRFGNHGLPLMGSGDWNDGMDLVGGEGKGESVWLGFFLHVALTRFAEIARVHGDGGFADRCLEEAKRLAENIEEHSWDGAWYRRAYFDDGTPLGSGSNQECRIDSLAQSWAVISGVGAPERTEKAMAALHDHLVDREHMVVKLFEPPFDASPLQPGYIKGYVPGVRENGGQYTHGAIWAGIAYAEMRDSSMTWEMQRLLNPVNHALTTALADRYKVEPYVISADVYSNPQHPGRGGWSWYTGSASWMYRFMLENILGFRLESDHIRITPCIPGDWRGFKIRYRSQQSVYDIDVTRTGIDQEKTTTATEGIGDKATDTITLAQDGTTHRIEVRFS